MKQYVIFMYDVHRPSGGWNDVLRDRRECNVLSFDTVDEANGHATRSNTYKWRFDVVDLHTGEVVLSHF